MADHDQRFKTLVQEFFVEFLTLFLPEVKERVDLTTISWLQQEIFPEREAMPFPGLPPTQGNQGWATDRATSSTRSGLRAR